MSEPISEPTIELIRKMVLRTAILRCRQVRADPRYVHWRRWGEQRRAQFDAMLRELGELLDDFRSAEREARKGNTCQPGKTSTPAQPSTSQAPCRAGTGSLRSGSSYSKRRVRVSG